MLQQDTHNLAIDAEKAYICLHLHSVAVVLYLYKFELDAEYSIAK